MLTPEELRKLSIQAQKDKEEKARLAAIDDAERRVAYIKKTYDYYLKEIPFKLEAAAKEGLKEINVYGWTIDGRYVRFVEESAQVGDMLKKYLENQGYTTHYRHYEFTGSDDSGTDDCCELIVSWQ